MNVEDGLVDSDYLDGEWEFIFLELLKLSEYN